MEHYVRTKDTIFQLSYQDGEYLYTIDGKIGCKPNEIVAQADTIGELLDEYLVVDGNQSARYRNLHLAKSIKGTLYGNILIDGLSNSVAKYNKAIGKWELL